MRFVPWPRVLSLPERFVGDPASLACDNIYFKLKLLHTLGIAPQYRCKMDTKSTYS